jgi:hypothetical protein
MKTLITAVTLIVVLAACTTLAPSQAPPPTRVRQLGLYQCPDHPEIQATWPAQCPVCGTALQAVAPFRSAASTVFVADANYPNAYPGGQSYYPPPQMPQYGNQGYPPPSGSQYGYPPSGQYGSQGYPPSIQYGQGYPPGTPYGYPPSSQYGYPPSGQYGYPPNTQYGYPPNTQYGYPPSTQYGYPPGNQYGQGYPPGTQYGYPPGSPYGGQGYPPYNPNYGYGQGGYTYPPPPPPTYPYGTEPNDRYSGILEELSRLFNRGRQQPQ